MTDAGGQCLMRWTAALLSLALMLTLLGRPPVQRTQEARVLETAREMLGQGYRNWLIPHLNGYVRLEKPPLAYWLAAVAFKIGGVSEGVGRVPFALFGWLTLIATYLIGRWLTGERFGFLSAAALMGMWIFARHARLAETDILAAFFVTAAIVCIWRGAGGTGERIWFAASGVMIAGATMAKGLPAAFPVIFLLALAMEKRDARMIWRWTKSGAPFLAAAIGAPWFIYAIVTVGADKFTLETKKGLFGLQHTASFLHYFPDLLRAALPWTPVSVVALVMVARLWKHDPPARVLLLWFGSIFIPLLIAGQRQFHYLMPAMPALAVMTAWVIARTAKSSQARLATIAAVVTAAVMTVVAQAWAPSLRPDNPRTISAKIKSIGSGPYCFYGENVSLPVLFYLGQITPRAATPQELTELLARAPSMIVIAQTKSGVAPPPVPAGLIRVGEIPSEDQLFEVYQADR